MRTKTSSTSTSSGPSSKTGASRWAGSDFDRDDVRHGFIRALRKRKRPVATPYWGSGFNRWMIYDSAIRVGDELEVVSIDRDYVTMEALCSGMQSEGLCVRATFDVPTSEFLRLELIGMVCGFTFVPDEWRIDDLLAEDRITKLEWYYDPFLDERRK